MTNAGMRYAVAAALLALCGEATSPVHAAGPLPQQIVVQGGAIDQQLAHPLPRHPAPELRTTALDMKNPSPPVVGRDGRICLTGRSGDTALVTCLQPGPIGDGAAPVVLWQRRYTDVGRHIAMSPDDGVYVVSGRALVSIDPGGEERWQVPLPATAERGILVEESGAVLVTGTGQLTRVSSTRDQEVLLAISSPDREIVGTLRTDAGIAVHIADNTRSYQLEEVVFLSPDGTVVARSESRLGSEARMSRAPAGVLVSDDGCRASLYQPDRERPASRNISSCAHSSNIGWRDGQELVSIADTTAPSGMTVPSASAPARMARFTGERPRWARSETTLPFRPNHLLVDPTGAVLVLGYGASMCALEVDDQIRFCMRVPEGPVGVASLPDGRLVLVTRDPRDAGGHLSLIEVPLPPRLSFRIVDTEELYLDDGALNDDELVVLNLSVTNDGPGPAAGVHAVAVDGAGLAVDTPEPLERLDIGETQTLAVVVQQAGTGAPPLTVQLQDIAGYPSAPVELELGVRPLGPLDVDLGEPHPDAPGDTQAAAALFAGVSARPADGDGRLDPGEVGYLDVPVVISSGILLRGTARVQDRSEHPLLVQDVEHPLGTLTPEEDGVLRIPVVVPESHPGGTVELHVSIADAREQEPRSFVVPVDIVSARRHVSTHWTFEGDLTPGGIGEIVLTIRNDSPQQTPPVSLAYESSSASLGLMASGGAVPALEPGAERLLRIPVGFRQEASGIVQVTVRVEDADATTFEIHLDATAPADGSQELTL